MAIILGIVSQKGGVGKSTIARLIAREFAQNDWSVKIADMDIQQGTSFQWYKRRAAHDPLLTRYPNVDQPQPTDVLTRNHGGSGHARGLRHL